MVNGLSISFRLPGRRGALVLVSNSLAIVIILFMTLDRSYWKGTSKDDLRHEDELTIRQQQNDSAYDATTTNHRRLQFDSYDPNQMLGKFNVARAKFMVKLAEDYGPENVKLLFETTMDGTPCSMARRVFEGSRMSWDRLKRKVAMKLLRVQIGQQPQPFIWATGGHSASAGHGNLFNESYTAILESGGSPIFEAVGLNFKTRRYAMGATSCGMEINCCIKEVFGLDIDVLSWDYGMTTGKDNSKTELYFHRAALLPNRPALVGILMGRGKYILESMEPLGFAVFAMDATIVVTAVPDTAGKTLEEINKMPPFVRSFRCENGIEKGEPTCGNEKYTTLPNNDPCNGRKGRVSWHPGWKWHALYGNLMVLFWIEIIADALQEIIQQGSDPKALLSALQIQEDQEVRPFLSKDVRNIKFVHDDLNSIADIPNEVIYWSPNFCHTARLPAEIRYQGFLTESDNKGGYHNYDRGYEIAEVRGTANDQMPVTWERSSYQEFCKNYEIVIDHQDFFMVNYFGWSTLVLPNPSEKVYYGGGSQGLTKQPLLGYISICLAGCGWGCPKGVLTLDDFRTGTTIQVMVNGVKVQNYTPFRDCAFLKHSDGHQWRANSDGLFEISAKTEDAQVYARISSIVIW